MALMSVENEKLYRVGEVAEIFRVDVRTVERWQDAGKLKGVRTPGGHRRFFESEIRKFLEGEPKDE